MKDYYCFDIQFQNVDFDSYDQAQEKVKESHHAHLFVKDNEIEIWIFFEPKTAFDRKFLQWTRFISWNKFGSFISILNEQQNRNLLKIDFSNTSLVGASTSTDYIAGDKRYVSVKINNVKFYWSPNSELLSSADFFLEDAGFKVVKSFYAPLFGSDGKFEISRMNGMDEFYQIGKVEFRPEFNFHVEDKKENAEAKVIKQPKIHFNFKQEVIEDEVIRYSEVVLLLTSFYFHQSINYVISKIHLPNYTISIKRIQNQTRPQSHGSLWAFNPKWNFHKFIKLCKPELILESHSKLSMVINLFNQANLVSGNSGFLIHFNIIEICMGGNKSTQAKFVSTLPESEKLKRYDSALTILLESIEENDHSDFINKWEGLKKKLEFKPMNSPIKEFLIAQKLPIDKFPIPIERLKKLRDYLTHGSIKSIKQEELDKANKLLYRISGILILNLMGIEDWTFNTDFN